MRLLLDVIDNCICFWEFRTHLAFMEVIGYKWTWYHQQLFVEQKVIFLKKIISTHKQLCKSHAEYENK